MFNVTVTLKKTIEVEVEIEVQLDENEHPPDEFGIDTPSDEFTEENSDEYKDGLCEKGTEIAEEFIDKALTKFMEKTRNNIMNYQDDSRKTITLMECIINTDHNEWQVFEETCDFDL